MTCRILAPFCLCALLLAGCTFPNILTPYKLDIPQGNEITAEQVAKLKVGMTRAQVRFILGTPLLTDPFHADRWDYLFSDARNGKLRSKRSYTVTFESDKLVTFDGDALPAAKTASAPDSAAKTK